MTEEAPNVPAVSDGQASLEGDRATGLDNERRPAAPSGASSAQSELDLGVVSTGSSVVDKALRPLAQLSERPVSDHAEAYEQVLADLTEAMTETAQAHDSGAPPVTR